MKEFRYIIESQLLRQQDFAVAVGSIAYYIENNLKPHSAVVICGGKCELTSICVKACILTDTPFYFSESREAGGSDLLFCTEAMEYPDTEGIALACPELSALINRGRTGAVTPARSPGVSALLRA